MHGWVVWAPFRDLSQPLPPGLANLRGLQAPWSSERARQRDLGAQGPGKWLSACVAILRPGIYVIGTRSLNPRGQRGIWVNGKLKMELK